MRAWIAEVEHNTSRHWTRGGEGCQFDKFLLIVYAIPKIKMWYNLQCLKARLRLLCNKYQRHSSLNLVSGQIKLCHIYFRNGVSYLLKNLWGQMIYTVTKWRKKSWSDRSITFINIYGFLLLWCFPRVDSYAKDGGPGAVWHSCSFYHDSLCAHIIRNVDNFAMWAGMCFKSMIYT